MAVPPLKGEKKLLTAQLSRPKWPQRPQLGEASSFTKRQNPQLGYTEPLMGKKWRGGQVPTWGLWNGQPSVRLVEMDTSLQMATIVQDSGEGSVSEPPNPRGPLTFKYSSRIGKESQLVFLKN